MTFGERIAAVRKARKLSQSQVGKIIGINGDALGRYERGEVTPSIEMAGLIANALGVSLDYLVGNIDADVDQTTLKRIIEIQRLPVDEQGHLFFMLDAMLRDAKTRQAYGS